MRDEGAGRGRVARSAVLVAPSRPLVPQPPSLDLSAELEPILSARDTDTLGRRLLDAIRPLGFDRLVYGLARFVTSAREGASEDLFIFSSLPEAYNRVYFGEGMFRHAPMMAWVRHHTGARSWSWARNRAMAGLCSPQELAVLEFNRRHDVVAGYSLSFGGLPGNGKGAYGLFAAPGIEQAEIDRLWSVQGKAITALAHVAHLRFAALARPPLARPLTARQREVLEWVANGKNVTDIADIIGLRPATVEKHLRLARETLGAETTVQAAVKAALLNQIFIAAPDIATASAAKLDGDSGTF